MRYIPVDGLTEGMVVGKDLYDQNHQPLLRRGTTVQRSYAERIKKLGYQGVYIDDDMSKDIIIKDVINDEIRMKMVQTVKDVCIYSNENNIKKPGIIAALHSKLTMTKELIANIIEDLISSKDTMVNLIDLKFYDDYTFFHSVNVAVLSIVIGVGMNLSKDELYNLGIGAILHDIGKTFVPKEILNKKAKLTNEEFDIMKKHSEYGYRYLKETFSIPVNAYVAVLQHHEKFNGTGYPSAIAKDDISILGRIIGIADVYDALISNRPYRKALLPSEGMEFIMANGGIMFDIELTKVFAKKVAPFPVGTYVGLSNGYIGIVAQNFEEACMRPCVKVILDPDKNNITPFYYDLMNDKQLRNITVTGMNSIDKRK